MNTTLQKHFAKMGSRINVRHVKPRRFADRNNGLTIDILRDRVGEFFALDIHDPNLKTQVLQVDKKDKHLLLMVKDFNGMSKYLCGHDERHWFVAGVDENTRNIKDAKEKLKPREAIGSQKQFNVKPKLKNRRRNQGFIRQGEWFFIPKPNFNGKGIIHKNEPIQRGRSKPHIVEEIIRYDGNMVYVHKEFPDGISQEAYNKYIKGDNAKRIGWQTRVSGAVVLGRGKVKHPDHKTIILKGWHHILTNREANLQSVAFLD